MPIIYHLGGRGVASNSSAEDVAVVGIKSNALAVLGDNVDGSLGGNTEQGGGRLVNANHVVLAVGGVKAVLSIVVEERVETTTIDENVRRVLNTETPGTSAGIIAAAGEVRVRVVRVGSERSVGVRVALHVGGLGLDGTHEDVLGIGNVVVDQLRVLSGGTPEPSSLGRLNEETTTVVDVDLTVVGKIKLVIGNPTPNVLEVDGSRGSDVEEHERTNALGVGSSGRVRGLGAGIGLQTRAGGTTNTEVSIPHTRRSRSRASEVPLNKDSTGLGTSSLEDDIGNLNITRVTALTDLEHGSGLGLVGEGVTGSDNHGPNLTNNLGTSRDLEGARDDVGTVVEVDNLSIGETIEDSLESSSIISRSVTLGTLSLNGDKVGSSDTVVLGLGSSTEVAIAISERSGTSRSSGGSSDSLATISGVDTTLGIRRDATAGENNSAGALVLDGILGTGEVNVVENQSTVGVSLGGIVKSEDTGGGSNLGVEHDNLASGLGTAASSQIKTNIGIGDGDTREGPEPVPVHVKSSRDTVEGKVLGGELLVTEEHTIETTVESKIGHEATGTVVHEDTLLLVGGRLGVHVELDVLERSGLGNLPVNTGTSIAHTSKIDLEVSDLTEEVVLVGPPVVASVIIRIRVDDTNTLETSVGLDGGDGVEVTNEVSVVVRNDGSGNKVSSGREVDDGRGGGLGVTTLSATRAISDGAVDSSGIVGGTVTFGTVVGDVTEDLVVSSTTEGDAALTVDVGEPPVGVTLLDLNVRGGSNWGGEELDGQEARGDEATDSNHVDD